MNFLIITIIAFTTTIEASIAGDSKPGYYSNKTCTKNEYREEYFPGDRNNPGYIKTWEETVEVPCATNNQINTRKMDLNNCSEGTITGGIIGGGIATAISRGKDRWWAIPAGIFGGSMVGCQIDGG